MDPSDIEYVKDIFADIFDSLPVKQERKCQSGGGRVPTVPLSHAEAIINTTHADHPVLADLNPDAIKTRTPGIASDDLSDDEDTAPKITLRDLHNQEKNMARMNDISIKVQSMFGALKLNLDIIEVPGDGRCLFHAIAVTYQSILHIDITAVELIECVTNVLKCMPDDCPYYQHVLNVKDLTAQTLIQDYDTRMGNPEIDCVILSTLFNVEMIIVYLGDNPYAKIVRPKCHPEDISISRIGLSQQVVISHYDNHFYGTKCSNTYPSWNVTNLIPHIMYYRICNQTNQIIANDEKVLQRLGVRNDQCARILSSHADYTQTHPYSLPGLVVPFDLLPESTRKDTLQTCLSVDQLCAHEYSRYMDGFSNVYHCIQLIQHFMILSSLPIIREHRYTRFGDVIPLSLGRIEELLLSFKGSPLLLQEILMHHHYYEQQISNEQNDPPNSPTSTESDCSQEDMWYKKLHKMISASPKPTISEHITIPNAHIRDMISDVKNKRTFVLTQQFVSTLIENMTKYDNIIKALSYAFASEFLSDVLVHYANIDVIDHVRAYDSSSLILIEFSESNVSISDITSTGHASMGKPYVYNAPLFSGARIPIIYYNRYLNISDAQATLIQYTDKQSPQPPSGSIKYNTTPTRSPMPNEISQPAIVTTSKPQRTKLLTHQTGLPIINAQNNSLMKQYPLYNKTRLYTEASAKSHTYLLGVVNTNGGHIFIIYGHFIPIDQPLSGSHQYQRDEYQCTVICTNTLVKAVSVPILPRIVFDVTSSDIILHSNNSISRPMTSVAQDILGYFVQKLAPIDLLSPQYPGLSLAYTVNRHIHSAVTPAMLSSLSLRSDMEGNILSFTIGCKGKTYMHISTNQITLGCNQMVDVSSVDMHKHACSLMYYKLSPVNIHDVIGIPCELCNTIYPHPACAQACARNCGGAH